MDIADYGLELARRFGADRVVNAATHDAVAEVQKHVRGAHGVPMTAVLREAFAQGIGMLHKRGTMSLVGLLPGGFPLPIFDVMLNAKTVRGAIVGTRADWRTAMQREEPLTGAGFLATQFHKSWRRSAAVGVGRQPTRSGRSGARFNCLEPVIGAAAHCQRIAGGNPGPDRMKLRGFTYIQPVNGGPFAPDLSKTS